MNGHLARSRTMRSQFFLTFVLSLVLTACGGGSGEADAPVAASPAEPTFEEQLRLVETDVNAILDDWSEGARDQYAGSRELALIDRNNAGNYIDLLTEKRLLDYQDTGTGIENSLSIEDIVREIMTASSIFTSTSRTEEYMAQCSHSGERWHSTSYLADTSESLQLQLAFLDSCNTGNTIISGEVLVLGKFGEQAYDYKWYGFNNIRMKLGGKEFLFSGAIRDSNVCADNYLEEVSFLISDVDDDTHILYDKFRKMADWPVDNRRCESTNSVHDAQPHTNPYIHANHFDGSIYHSDYGRVDVQTEEKLRISISPIDFLQAASTGALQLTIDDLPAANENYGAIELNGASASKLTLTTKTIKNTDPAFRLLDLSFVELNFYENDTLPPVPIRVNISSFINGSLSDIGDDDNDGIPNGVEDASSSLDRNDPDDANVARFQTSLTPLQSYQLLQTPGSPTFQPLALDQSVDVDMVGEYIPDQAHTSLRAIVTISKLTDLVVEGDSVVEINLSTESGSSWDVGNLPSGCTVAESTNTLYCTYDYENANVEHMGTSRELSSIAFVLPVLTMTDDEITITANLLSAENDINQQNDMAISHVLHPYELLLEPYPEHIVLPDFQVASPESMVANLENSLLMTARVSQIVDHPPADVTIEFQVPEGMAFIDADFISSGSQPLISRCVGTFNVSCTMEEVVNTDMLTLNAEFFLLSPSDQEIQFELTSNYVERERNNNVSATRILYRQSSSAIQALIDSAADGDTVVLPAGTYNSSLDLNYRSINLEGASIGGRTILVTGDRDRPAIINTGPRMTINNIDFQTTGAPIVALGDENLTISNGLITPVDGIPHEVTHLIKSQDGRGYRLLNNKIANFGVAENSICHNLIFYDELAGFDTPQFFERNLFLNNHCEQLLLVSLYYRGRNVSTASSSIFNNNTFVDNPNLFRFIGDFGLPKAEFRNNIIYGAGMILEYDSGLFHTGIEADGLTSSRNLVFNSSRMSLLTAEMNNSNAVAIEKTDLNVDPQFKNPENGDYSLMASSPAIDKGTEPFPYYWPYTNFVNADKMPSADMLIFALDGDQNGVEQFDIGAFEFNPITGQ